MKRKHVVILLLIIVVFFLLRYFGFLHYLSLQSMQEHADMAAEFIQMHYFLSAVLYVLFYGSIITVALPGFAPLTMLGGYIFGTIPGAVYAMLGSFIGSILAYGIVKLFLQNYIVTHYEKSIRLFANYVHQYGIANALIVLHFLTIIPFFLINAFAAIFDVSLSTFLWTTLIGCLPMVLIYSFAGKQLHEVDSVSDIFSPTIIMLLVLLLLLAIAPMILRRFLKKGNGSNNNNLTQ